MYPSPTYSLDKSDGLGLNICLLDTYAHSVYNNLMTVREIESILKDDGWFFSRQIGSHRQYKHLTKKGKVTVPFHRGDLDKGTAKSIFKQAGINYR